MITDERLRRALEEYDKAVMAALPEPSACNHQFSPRFERKMRGILRMAKHPVAYKTLQRAACILLALLALFGGMIAFNPDVRAAVIEWVKEQFGQFSHYYHTGETTPEPAERTQYELGWLPEGYTLVDTIPGENCNTLVCVNESYQIMQFNYYYEAADGPFISEKDHARKPVLIGDNTADVYLALDPKNGSAIVWTDPDNGTLFYISAVATEDELIQMAASVAEKN